MGEADTSTARTPERELLGGAYAALIDGAFPSDPGMRPSFVSNDFRRGRKVVSTIRSELSGCCAFDFSVAFVTCSGITPLLQELRELERRGVPGRILTTDYLAFSEPKALEKLDSLGNVEVRMYRTANVPDRFGFHTKGYLFEYGNGFQKILIGSSNLTDSALSLNREWNLELTSRRDGSLVREIRLEFEELWSAAEPLADVIDTYRAMRQERQRALAGQRVIEYDQIRLEPNAMQLAFVHNLDKIIRRGCSRALLISATGTGKTYASAFAMRHINPRRVLFLAHREQVLKQSIASYKRVLGKLKGYGLLSGSSHDFDQDYLFATMQTMSKDSHLSKFAPDSFDVIVVDEVHRAGSASYQKIMGYFNPKLYLGMTASPDRPDGFDIYGLFDNEIAYEIRLQGALENNLLCPFHYFGITDLQIDGRPIDDLTEFSYLVSSERVDYVIEQARYFGYSGDRVKGLVFCRSKREAATLSGMFNTRGFSTMALSGDDSQEVRERAIERLVGDSGVERSSDALDYIFTVDIFNEGVDIPEVNQVIMLRPTESPIIFVQQLGRGLRKAQGKDFVVVLDFIGNYANNYMIPIALSGDRTYNKDSIRKYVMEGDRVIPGCSSVHFDEISRARIFESIDNSGITYKFLKESYTALKHKLGRIPFMVDFQEHGEIDPMLFVERKKSYYRFLSSVEPAYAKALSEEEHLALEFASRYFGNGMRPHELVALRKAVDEACASRGEIGRTLVQYGVERLDDASYVSMRNVLSGAFVNAPGDKRSYEKVSLVEFDGDDVYCSDDLAAMMRNGEFARALDDLVEFGLARYREKYTPADHGLKLYEKYTRKDACRLLNWEKDNSSTVYGYRLSYGTCPIFVTYNKSEEIASTTQYADEFVTPRVFSWMTRSRLTLSSPEVLKIVNAERDELDMRLFIKKSDGEGADFYYFGRVRPLEWRETTQADGKGGRLPIVNFRLELEHPARQDLYEYFDGPSELGVMPTVA